MPKQEAPLQQLAQFLPEGTFADIAPYFHEHIIQLTLTRERKTVLGDYREPTRAKPFHRITVNVNLNQYNFLITLVHELAHMRTLIMYGRRVAPHGKEWKNTFREMLLPFLGRDVFPDDVELALVQYMDNPAASTCTDPRLYKALFKYDDNKDGATLVCDLQIGQKFKTDKGRVFEKVKQLRTRSLCTELKTGKQYYFPGIYEVSIID